MYPQTSTVRTDRQAPNVLSVEKRFDFVGRLDGRTELGDGSVRFTARLTRTGVFDYGDHTELRTEEEVFAPAALDSFRGLVVTDGHQGWVTPETWRDLAKGHVGDDVRRDGNFVVASLIVKDSEMLRKIDAGDIREVSMGYAVELRQESGETPEGERYDAVQTNIRGNHAALGPDGWARAGREARLLDGAAYPPDMSTVVQRVDAPTNDQIRADLDAARADSDVLRKERDDARKRADTLEAERDAARADAEKSKKDLDAQKASEASRIDARLNLLDAARSVLGKDFEAKGKTDREVREAALRKLDPSVKFDGKSDDYVAARFDLAIEGAKKDDAAVGAVNVVSSTPAAPSKSRLDEAYEKIEKEREALRKDGPPPNATIKR